MNDVSHPRIVPPKCAGYTEEMRRAFFAVMGVGVAFVLGFYLGKISSVTDSRVATIPKNEVASSTSTAGYEWYPVRKVVDGDTLVV